MPYPVHAPRPARGSLIAALLASAILAPRSVVADEARPALSSPSDQGRHRIIPHQKIGPGLATSPTSSDGWWAGAAGIALALAAFGGVSVVAKRYGINLGAALGLGAGGGVGAIRVVGRASLSAKHSVYLVRAGDRVLIVGTGPGGSPSLLGELDPAETEVPVTVPDRPASSPSIARVRVGGMA